VLPAEVVKDPGIANTVRHAHRSLPNSAFVIDKKG
jgi:hypothetical protein